MKKIKLKSQIKIAGVYAIINTSNNRVYVGGSTDLYNRQRKHSWTLRHKQHFSKEMQKEYNENPNAFEFRILETTENLDELRAIEQKYLDQYQSYKPEFGYNISIKSDRCVHDERSKERLRIASTGRKQSLEWRRKKARFGKDNHFYGKNHTLSARLKMQARFQAGPFKCIETGEVFQFIREAAKRFNVSEINIFRRLKGITKYSKRTKLDYHFEYQ